MHSLAAALSFTAAALAVSGAAASPEATKTAKMPFQECLGIIAEVTQETGAMPATLASTGDLRTVRINAEDGFVTVSCDRVAGTMTLSKTGPAAAAAAATR